MSGIKVKIRGSVSTEPLLREGTLGTDQVDILLPAISDDQKAAVIAYLKAIRAGTDTSSVETAIINL